MEVNIGVVSLLCRDVTPPNGELHGKENRK